MKTGAVRVFLAVLMILSRSSGFNALRRRMSFSVLPSNRGLAAKKKEDNKYEHTILLPHTTFDQRANSAVREPEIQKWWADNRVYENLAASNPGSSFVLHDGPPYANGDLHIGHALNKILKDIVNRFQLLQGKKVSFVPGWDCHGLPIETKVVQSMKPELRRTISPLELRKKAAEFAENTMKTQRESFMRYGVWGHWNTPYLTLQPKYEASQLRVFGEMVAKGYIYRGMKPVHWSPSSRTALAEAELEYPEHVSKSVFIGFHVAAPNSKLESIVERIVADRNLSNHPKIFAAIWTTTPWTIPANQAIAVHPSIEYALVANAQVSDGALFVVAKNLVDSFAKQFPSGDSFPTFDVIESISGAELVGSMYQHPLCDRRSPIVAGGDYITADHGTGLVHTAPGHGAEDYITGLANGLPIFSPVDDAGRFTVEAGEALVGLDVLTNGTDAVIEALRERGCLLSTKNYTHKYPHDWRTKKPTIFRATEQWFASISSFRDSAINATESVEWVPDGGKIRMINMLKSRSDWCISRQRAWGVPIPVFYHKESGAALMTKETIEHVAKVFEAHPTGSDAWWELSEKDLMPPGLPWENYEKGTDTMDVWFDSGTSWSGVLKSQEGGEGRFPSDMYLEGTDQFRGWFQSSLLTSVAVDGVAPYRSVLVHGFVLDEKGQKMSKSLGNVVDPKLIISGGTNQKLHPAYGADTLRMWAAGVDYTSDVHIGDNIVKTTSENCRKLRNTLRFLIGGLGDFDPKRNLISHDKLADIDRYILGKLTSTVNEVENAYREHQFSRVLKTISEFVTHDLSAFYLDISKDRLYISNQNDFRRRSCQTTFYYIMEQLAVMVAPIAPHLSEDLWLNIGYTKPSLSIFGRGWVGKNERFEIDETNHKNWEFLRKLRLDVNQCLEVVRSNKQIGATQHSRIILCAEGNTEMLELLRRYQGDHSFLPKPVKSNGIDDLRLLFISSQVDVVTRREELESHEPLHVIGSTDSVSGISIGVQFAKGRRCERCWFHSEDVGSIVEMNDLCSRCADVLKNRTL